jgi:hypothetical protein
VNLRPPGGLTTDLMNYSCDIDIYSLWAELLTGVDLHDFRYEWRYHSAHVGRRAARRYRRTKEELRQVLGAGLLLTPELPPLFREAMGDEIFLVRHADEQSLKEMIALILEPA